MIKGIPIPWKKIITITVVIESAQKNRQNVAPSIIKPKDQRTPLEKTFFSLVTRKEPNNAPIAIQPSTKAKSEASPFNIVFTRIGTPTTAGPIINRLLINVIIMTRNIDLLDSK